MASQPPTYLIDTLYYNVGAPYSTLVLIPKLPGDTAFCGINIIPLTNSAFVSTPPNKITFNSYRMPSNTEDDFIIGQYLQQLAMVETVSGNMTMTVLTSIPSNPLDMFVATTTYEDPGDFYQTTISGATFLVLNGSGKYSYAKTVQVTYDNSVTPGVRTMQVYGYP